MKLVDSHRPERRQSPRYIIQQPVNIVLANGTNLTAETCNISISGLQLTCDSWVTEEIELRGIKSHVLNRLCFKIIITIAINDSSSKLVADCRVMSSQRLSQNKYMLNIKFLGFNNGSEKVLYDFLEQYSQKKTLVNDVA